MVCRLRKAVSFAESARIAGYRPGDIVRRGYKRARYLSHALTARSVKNFGIGGNDAVLPVRKNRGGRVKAPCRYAE